MINKIFSTKPETQPTIPPEEIEYLQQVNNFQNRKQEEFGFHIYNITGDIDYKSYNDFQNYLYQLDIKYRNFSSENIPGVVLQIETYGGDLFSALQIYTLIKSSKISVYTYTSYGAFSAGATILMQGDERYISETQFTLVHPFTHFQYGKYHELKSSSDWNEKIMEKTKKIIVESTRMTAQEVEEIMNNGKDEYYTQEESLRKGIVDYIGTFAGSYFDVEYTTDENGNIIDQRTKDDIGESVQQQKQKHRTSKLAYKKTEEMQSLTKRKKLI